MSTAGAGWEHFEHRADIGVRGYGSTLDEAFEQAAMALIGIVTDVDRVHEQTSVVISCTEPDRELLFVDWLNALIYEMATRRLLFRRFEVDIDPQGRLTARAYGEPIDVRRHQPAVEIKGATYTELRVRERDGLWSAQCVVDV
jgi:tRNA nucleotidyltransferase (CCA-adding enzyme)